MEKPQKEENSFFQRLLTPAGLGASILISAGIGFGLVLLKNKLLKGGDESPEALLEQLKKKLKKEKGTQIYSKELILLYYKNYQIYVDRELGKLMKERMTEKLKVIDDIPKYKQTRSVYEEMIINKIGLGIEIFIRQCGGDHQVFLKSDEKWRVESKEVAGAFQTAIQTIGSKDPLFLARKKPLTADLVKEVLKYLEEILGEIISKELYKQFDGIPGIKDWVTDKVYAKFEVYDMSAEFQDAKVKFGKDDIEIQKSSTQVITSIREICGHF